MILKNLEKMVNSKIVAPKFKTVKLAKHYYDLDYEDVCLNLDGGIMCYDCAQSVDISEVVHNENCCCTLCYKCKMTRIKRNNPSIIYTEFNETHFFECLEVLEWCGDYAREHAWIYLQRIGFDDCLYLYIISKNDKKSKLVETSSFMVIEAIERVCTHREAMESMLCYEAHYEKAWGIGCNKYEINKVLEYLFLHTWKRLFDGDSRIVRARPFRRMMDGYLEHRVLEDGDNKIFKIIYNNNN